MKGFIVIGAAIVLVIISIFSVDAGLYSAYALMVLAAGAAIVLPLTNIVQSPGQVKKGLFALAGMVVLFVVSYALAGAEVAPDQAAKGVTENTSKMVGAGLTMFYLIALIAVVGLIYSEINKAFK